MVLEVMVTDLERDRSTAYRAVRKVNNMRYRYYILVFMLSTAPLLVGGCATNAQAPARRASIAHNLLFNPSWTGVATFDAPRSDWPVTIAHVRSTEQIDYRETYIDLQGQSGASHDYFYRRFESVRRGSASR